MFLTTLSTRQSLPSLVSSIMGAVVGALSLFRVGFKYAERAALLAAAHWAARQKKQASMKPVPSRSRAATVEWTHTNPMGVGGGAAHGGPAGAE